MNSSNAWEIVRTDKELIKGSSNTALGYSTIINADGLQGFHINENLSTGWYKIEYVHKWTSLFGLRPCSRICDTKEFGVGDVYFIAGQSNASGFNEASDNVEAKSISNTYEKQGDNKMVRAYQFNGDAVNSIRGLPSKIRYDKNPTTPPAISEFGQLKKDLSPIYPNGRASWSWAPLGNEIANKTNTPTLFFNIGQPNTSLLWDWIGTDNNYVTRSNKTDKNTLIGKFYQTLGFYGNILGAKAVLWHQGERDSQILAGRETTWNKTSSDVLNNYSQYLTELIDGSRSSITGLGSNLSWFVSQVSYSSAGNNTNYSTCITDTDLTSIGYKDKYFHSSLHSLQFNDSNRKIFLGVNSDFIDPQNWNGNPVDFVSSQTDCARAAKQRIHFTGDWLGKLGHAWYRAIEVKNSEVITIPATKLLKLTSVTFNNQNYIFTIESVPNAIKLVP